MWVGAFNLARNCLAGGVHILMGGDEAWGHESVIHTLAPAQLQLQLPIDCQRPVRWPGCGREQVNSQPDHMKTSMSPHHHPLVNVTAGTEQRP